MKALQQEKTAIKRLENVRQDHEKRIMSLQESQVNKTLYSVMELENRTF